ncbi:MAG: cysteine desulfurase family protein [Anaerolineales bacterium]|jgi:cysteine desulfurase
MSSDVVYLDNSATTPVDERVFDAMKPYFSGRYGNPSSLHRYGQEAEAAIEAARETVARILNCSPGSIFFTACATESNNLVLQGLATSKLLQEEPYHVLTTPVEHPSVLRPLGEIQKLGRGMFTYLPIDHAGRIRFPEFEGLVNEDISLVSIIFGNNEVGTLNPVEQVGEFLQDKPTLLHTDAVQCANLIDLDVDELMVDFLTLSAHKFYGPKGVGILYARDPSTLKPIMQGGSQEAGMRPGTHNVPLIVGAAKALEISQDSQEAESVRLRDIRDIIITAVLKRIPECELTGDPEDRLSHHASFVFADVDSNELLASLDLHGFACSSGSACKVGNPEPSSLLLSMGYSEGLARGALRVTLGRSSTKNQAGAFVDTLVEVIERLRSGDMP